MARGKFNLKNAHFNPKKKKPNKNHKQKYFKKENKPIKKDNLLEIVDNREELKDYVNQEFIAYGFITNTYGYEGTKRLINSIILPIKKNNKKLYIKHAWTKTEKTKNIPHGYHHFKVKIKQYKDLYNNKSKYGIVFISLV